MCTKVHVRRLNSFTRNCCPSAPWLCFGYLCLGMCACFVSIRAAACMQASSVASPFCDSRNNVGVLSCPCLAKGWAREQNRTCFLCLHIHGFHYSQCILDTFIPTLGMNMLQSWASAPTRGPWSSVRATHLRQHRSKGPGQSCIPHRWRHARRVRGVCFLQMNHRELYVAKPKSVGPSQGGSEPGREGNVKVPSDLLHHLSLRCWAALPLPHVVFLWLA